MWKLNNNDSQLAMLIQSPNCETQRNKAITMLIKYGKEKSIKRCDELIFQYNNEINSMQYYNKEKVSLYDGKIRYWNEIKILCNYWEDQLKSTLLIILKYMETSIERIGGENKLVVKYAGQAFIIECDEKDLNITKECFDIMVERFKKENINPQYQYMENFEFLKDGEIGLILKEGDRIIQLGINKEIYQAINICLASLSQGSPLVKMSEKHDLVLKSTVKTFKKQANGKM